MSLDGVVEREEAKLRILNGGHFVLSYIGTVRTLRCPVYKGTVSSYHLAGVLSVVMSFLRLEYISIWVM